MITVHEHPLLAVATDRIATRQRASAVPEHSSSASTRWPLEPNSTPMATTAPCARRVTGRSRRRRNTRARTLDRRADARRPHRRLGDVSAGVDQRSAAGGQHRQGVPLHHRPARVPEATRRSNRYAEHARRGRPSRPTAAPGPTHRAEQARRPRGRDDGDAGVARGRADRPAPAGPARSAIRGDRAEPGHLAGVGEGEGPPGADQARRVASHLPEAPS